MGGEEDTVNFQNNATNLAGGTLNVTANVVSVTDTVTTAGGNVIIDAETSITVNLINAGAGDVTLDAGGPVNGVTDDATADVVGSTISLTAEVVGIGTTTALDITAATALNSDTTADNGNQFIDSIGDLPVGLVDAGTGNVTLRQPGR